MKLHPPLVHAVVRALDEIFEEGRQADRVIEYLLKSNKKYGVRDRAFLAENIYEIVRWWRLLKYITNESESPYHWFAALKILQQENLPNWEEFKGIYPSEVFKRHAEAEKIRKIHESIPDWLDAIGEQELGTHWDTELAALNNQAEVILRVNTLKITKQQLKVALLEEEIETHYLSEIPEALVLKNRTNVFKTLAFKNGYFEVQDAASQMVAPMLDIQAGMRVIDACAGAGGKTLHIASLLQNKGRIIAMDTEERKLWELEKRAKRNGVSNIEPRVIESSKTIKRLKETADRLLLDVPCSGLGVLRRNPDAKWKLSAEFIAKIKETQAEIIQNYSQMLKIGGKMVYATCSILPSESEEQVAKFMKNNSEWQLLEEKRTLPSDGFDGFYMACLQRNK